MKPLAILRCQESDAYDRALERLPESIRQSWELDLQRGELTATAQDCEGYVGRLRKVLFEENEEARKERLSHMPLIREQLIMRRCWTVNSSAR